MKSLICIAAIYLLLMVCANGYAQVRNSVNALMLLRAHKVPSVWSPKPIIPVVPSLVSVLSLWQTYLLALLWELRVKEWFLLQKIAMEV